MKKLRLTQIMTALLLCVLTANAHDFEVDGVYYNITDSTELTVEVTYEGQLLTDYTNAINNSSYRGDVVIPTTVTQEGITYRVTSIGGSAFYQAHELISVTISEGITSIGLGAFTECSLYTITLPESLVTIGEYAFNTCRNLTSITIPRSVTSIEQAAFAQCQSLVAITIPETSKLSIIGGYAFYDCRSLTSITLPKSVTRIERRAFAKCAKLSSVYCYSEKVPATAPEVFLDSTTEIDTLYVPASAWASYKTTEPWNGFGNIVAQGSDPIAIDGKKWHIRTQVPYIDDRYTNDVFMWVEGDTIVEDIRYKKLYKQTRNVYDSSMETIEVGYCRQVGDKYYQNGKLMFDFGLQVGDKFTPQKGDPLTVKRIGSMTLNDGLSRKYLMVVINEEDTDTIYNADYWIEGLGSLRMGILTNDFQSVGLVKELQSCSYNEKYIYKKGDESKPYLVTEGKQWAICSTGFCPPPNSTTITYRLQGDTIIDSKRYLVEYESYDIHLTDWKPSGRYMREENGKVYSRYEKQEETILLDYGMQVGDTLRYNDRTDGMGDTSYVYACLVNVRDTILPNGDGVSRRCYDVSVGEYINGTYHPAEHKTSFIEDIGWLDWGLSDELFFTDGGYQRLLYVKQNDTILYQEESENKIFSQDMKWYGSIIDYYWGRPSIYNNLTYHIGADTITDRGFGQNLYRNDEYWGTLITMGEQVWLYPSEAFYKESWYADETEEPFLLYDFSLQLNDTLYYTFNTLGFSREKPKDDYFEYMVVKNVYHTYGRKIIEFDQGYRWAEGIGCLGASILNLWRPMTTNGDGVMESIDRVEENGQVIYSNGEFVNPNIESWLKAGMTWTENKQYTKDGNIVTRKVTISEGDTPGFYKVSSNDSKYKLPFTTLQVTNNKVYGHGLGDVFLLYDFSLKVGDKVFLLKYYCYGIDNCTYEYDQCYVTKVDTVVYNGVPRKRISISGDREDVWVEGIGSLTRVFPIDGVIDYEYYSVNAIFSEVLGCTYNGEILYHKSFTPAVKKGYGLYYGDTYLYKYTINEAEEVKDSTDFAVWNGRSVIYFDVDTVGTHAFTNATFRQGQILYFSDKLNCIMPDAFTDILMADNKSDEKNPFGDLCIVFSGDDAPCIEKSSISNYADTTYRITYVVPDLATYIASDIQWTYSQLVTIDDFIKGYVSPENEVTVTDSTEVDVTVGYNTADNSTNKDVILSISARPRKDIPIRIGDGENKDIYSRAPAWMRYTVELEITDTEEALLFADSKECTAYEDCEFDVTFTSPENNIVYVRSRSIDQYDRASEWAVETVNLDTAIDSIIIPTTNDAPYYDLQGRKVAHPTRGIYIRNGRKVIVK